MRNRAYKYLVNKSKNLFNLVNNKLIHNTKFDTHYLKLLVFSLQLI